MSETMTAVEPIAIRGRTLVGRALRRMRDRDLEMPDARMLQDEMFAAEEMRRLVLDAIERLPEPNREAVLSFLDGETAATLAARVGVTHQAVSLRLHRAIKLITLDVMGADKEREAA